MDYLAEKRHWLSTRKELIRAQRMILDMQEKEVNKELGEVEQAIAAMQSRADVNER